MATNNSVNEATAASGKVLQGQGVGTTSAFSTATYPATATGTGTILRADGTNWVATTSTYPNTNAVSTLLYASAANVMSALATANSGVLATDGSGVPSISTTPTVTSITFGSGAALNDFEQGTFAITIRGSSTAGTVTMTRQIGRYQRVGRLCTCNMNAIWTTLGGATGSVQCNNLPFSSVNTANAEGYGVPNSGGSTLTTAASVVPYFQTNQNAATVNINYYTGGTGVGSAGTITASNGFAGTLTYETT